MNTRVGTKQYMYISGIEWNFLWSFPLVIIHIEIHCSKLCGCLYNILPVRRLQERVITASLFLEDNMPQRKAIVKLFGCCSNASKILQLVSVSKYKSDKQYSNQGLWLSASCPDIETSMLIKAVWYALSDLYKYYCQESTCGGGGAISCPWISWSKEDLLIPPQVKTSLTRPFFNFKSFVPLWLTNLNI